MHQFSIFEKYTVKIYDVNQHKQMKENKKTKQQFEMLIRIHSSWYYLKFQAAKDLIKHSRMCELLLDTLNMNEHLLQS